MFVMEKLIQLFLCGIEETFFLFFFLAWKANKKGLVNVSFFPSQKFVNNCYRC